MSFIAKEDDCVKKILSLIMMAIFFMIIAIIGVYFIARKHK